MVGEGPGRSLLLCINAMPHGAALHEDDRVMPILPRNGCREADNKFRFCPGGDQLEASRGKMVAFVHHQMSVIPNPVIDHSLPHQALNQGYINPSGELPLSAPKPPDAFRGHPKESRQPLDPLLQKLLTMDENECIHAAFSDEPGGQHCFPKGSRRS